MPIVTLLYFGMCRALFLFHSTKKIGLLTIQYPTSTVQRRLNHCQFNCNVYSLVDNSVFFFTPIFASGVALVKLFEVCRLGALDQFTAAINNSKTM